MIKLKAVELEDYCICPLLYEKKYVLHEEPVRNKETAHFDGHSHIVAEAEKAIKELTGFYFHRLMDDRQIRYETLYKKWENKWWGSLTGKDIMEYIVPVNRSNRVRMNTNFINHLPKFHSRFHKPFKPIAVEKDIFYPHQEYMVESNIQMAYRAPTGLIRITKFIPYRIAPNKPSNDLDFIVQACGWMYAHDEDEVEVAYYCMMSPDEYNPFTIDTVDRRTMNNLSRIIKAFNDKESVLPLDCSGCSYKCGEATNENSL